MHYAHVDKIIRVIKKSSTEPCDAILSTGEHVVLKLCNNIQGNLSLVNEYICYRLATCLGILMPQSGICYVDSNTLDEAEILLPNNYGYAFYSKRIDKAVVIQATVLKKIVNKEMFFDILIFDHLVYNTDRNPGNLLLSMKKEAYLYAIDHTHVFKNECIWDGFCLKQGINSDDYLDSHIMWRNTATYGVFFSRMNLIKADLLKISNSFKLAVTKELLKTIIAELPREWDVKEENLEILIEYLLYRASHLNDIVDVILAYQRR